MEYIAETGEKFTDDDILRWAEEAENGFPNSTLEWTQGRIWETEKTPMRIKSLRAPESLWNLAAAKAKQEGLSESEWLRRAITRALIS